MTGRALRRLAAAWTIWAVATCKAAAETFVLVHGAFVGGWYWEPVAAGLTTRGHTVIAPDLAGHGTRSGEARSGASLEVQVDDVVAAITSAGEPVILVAHSYGGRPAAGAWDRARDRISAVILLEAMTPQLSGTLLFAEDTAQRQALARINPAAVAAGMLPPSDGLRSRYPGRVLAAQSLAALHGELVARNGPLPDTPGAYVLGEFSRARAFRREAGRVARERGWTLWEIESGHDMVQDAGEVLVRLLDDLSRDLPRNPGASPEN